MSGRLRKGHKMVRLSDLTRVLGQARTQEVVEAINAERTKRPALHVTSEQVNRAIEFARKGTTGRHVFSIVPVVRLYFADHPGVAQKFATWVEALKVRRTMEAAQDEEAIDQKAIDLAELSKQLIERRETLGLSIRELADEVGVSTSVLYRILNRRHPTGQASIEKAYSFLKSTRSASEVQHAAQVG